MFWVGARAMFFWILAKKTRNSRTVCSAFHRDPGSVSTTASTRMWLLCFRSERAPCGPHDEVARMPPFCLVQNTSAKECTYMTRPILILRSWRFEHHRELSARTSAPHSEKHSKRSRRADCKHAKPQLAFGTLRTPFTRTSHQRSSGLTGEKRCQKNERFRLA